MTDKGENKSKLKKTGEKERGEKQDEPMWLRVASTQER